MRAAASVIPVTRTRQGIEITELPFQVGPEKVVSRIQELVRDQKLTGVAAVNDFSDRTAGLKIVVECKPGVNAQHLLTQLYRLTPLEESFGVNNVVLVNGVPTTLGVWDLCRHYIDHRLEVIVRRTEYRLGRARDAMHLRQGRLIALDAIDLVVSIIRSSADTPQARERLMEQLSLSEIQATDILEMPLRRLTALARLELEGEIERLAKEIAEYEALLESPRKRRNLLVKELGELVESHGRPRRTRIVAADALHDPASYVDDPAERPEDLPCRVTLSTSGVVGREPPSGAPSATFGRHDVIVDDVATGTLGTVWALTSKGRQVFGSVADIGDVSGRSRGSAVGDVFALEKGEQILRLLAADPAPGSESGETDEESPLMVVTAKGVAKRVAPSAIVEHRSSGSFINLRPGDQVVAVFPAADDDDVVMVSSDAQALRCPAAGISVQGRGAGGVAGMRLKDGATVVGAGVATDDAVLLTVTDGQTAKVTDVAEIPAKGRGTGGVRVTKFRDEKRLEWAYIGPEAGIVIVVGTEENPAKPAPAVEPLTIPHTGRDLISRPTAKRLLAIGRPRW